MSNTPATAAAAFEAHRARAIAALARLTAAAESDFGLGAGPRGVTWGDAGSMANLQQRLTEISDMVFLEGEYKA
ncbi:MAG TPA: hypothetical protein VMV33_17380 [Rhodocyclaceae bacterium]|nr:hypothetical protein [Rhodocyclaceae bacterium]